MSLFDTWNPELLSSYDYDLPSEYIATHPEAIRGKGKLLVCDQNHDTFIETVFDKLLDYLNPNDLLVFNNAKVIAARVFATKETGGRVEIFIVRLAKSFDWVTPHPRPSFWAMTRSSNRLKINQRLTPVQGPRGAFRVTQFEHHQDGNLTQVTWDPESPTPVSPQDLLEQMGQTPLPPYILKQRDAAAMQAIEPEDKERYQTVFAQVAGAVAAPTASLHFSHALLQDLSSKGIRTTEITLDVGPGTFKPVSCEHITDHPMHYETYHIPEQVRKAVLETKANGAKVVAVGTTVMRTLEAEARKESPFQPGRHCTNIFLSPLNPPKFCDALITNFHLPKSTLFALVAGFMGLTRTHQAYQFAIAKNFRFYSYGDAMLIL